MFIFTPILTEKFLVWNFERPFAAQRKAISESNKTFDTASGVVGTYVNNIPLNDFEKITNLSSKSFKSVDIQIPRIYISSPIFNTEKYGNELQNIWLTAIHEDELENQYKYFNIYYDKNKIADENRKYNSNDATSEELTDMKKLIIAELDTNSKFKKVKFKGWYESDKGGDKTKSTTSDGKHYNFSAVYEQKNFKLGKQYRKVTAEFKKSDGKFALKDRSLKVK
ncbi:hypothetical protein P1T46_01760 [Streptococcus parauberis]|nr:hypothetical protein P1T46_01760 [Streptococcus parauberis]